MKVTGKPTAEGLIEITFTMTPEEASALVQQFEAVGTTSPSFSAQPAGLLEDLNPFKRKTHYCVTCEKTGQHTISAYGDFHAAIIAAGKCVPYGLTKGKCRKR